MDHRYGIQPEDGLPGNDDFGTMSSWFLFAAMGLYPLPGHDLYIVGSPLFPKMQIATRNITIVCHNHTKDNVYVQAIRLDGVVLTGREARFMAHSRLARGAYLEFVMGPVAPSRRPTGG